MDQNFKAFHEFVHQPQNKEVQEVFQSIIHEVSSIFDWKIKIALVKYRQQNGMNRHLPGQLVRAQNRLLNCKFTENAYDPANDNLFRLSPSPFKSFSFRDDTDKPVTSPYTEIPYASVLLIILLLCRAVSLLFVINVLTTPTRNFTLYICVRRDGSM